MKKSMKWLLATRVLLLVVALFVALAVKGEDRTLNVWKSDGTVVSFSLDEVPVTTYTDGNLVIKTTKTTGSTRTVLLPDYLCDLIAKQGFVFNGAPNMIYKELIRVEQLLGLPHFSLHKLRHFFASYMHELGFSDKQILEAGGWSTDRVMKSVYQHAMNMDAAKQKMADSVSGLLNV